MTEIKVINAMYDQKLFNEAVQLAFEECREKPNIDFFNIVLGILRTAREANFLDEALRSLKYLENFINDKNLDEVISSVEEIIKDEYQSLSNRIRGTVELGNLKMKDDKVLLNIMEFVQEKDIKIFAFRSALKIRGVSRVKIDQVFDQLNLDLLEPTLKSFNTIVHE